MDPQRWNQIQAIFEKACEMSGQRQERYVLQACGDDADLLEEVRSLLEADRDSNEALEGRAIDLMDLNVSLEGQDIGPFRVDEQIGAGGMGAVYLATRDDGKQPRQVALKLVRHGVASEQILKRFKREEQILSRLNHPNIARLLESGVSVEGWPYLAMEYVRGEPLDIFSMHQKLTLANRLLLFQTVCSTVAYAHSSGVIHRDLKPDNIYVTPFGAVKLLDFGISKLVDSDDEGTTRLTRTGMKVMTVEYGAPEQVRGEKITMATDIYGLGVVLYELICGFRPFSLEGPSLFAMQRAICDVPAPHPADLVKRIHASGNAEKCERLEAFCHGIRLTRDGLLQLLRGPAGDICMKALNKEPKDRQGNVTEMLSELKRVAA